MRFVEEGDCRVALYSCEPPIKNALDSGLRVERADSRDEWVDDDDAPFLLSALVSRSRACEKEVWGHTGRSHFL